MSRSSRISTLFATVAVFASLSSSIAFAGGGPTLQLRRTSIGTILVNSRGFTLYAFTKDGRNKDACARIRGCLGAWPVLSASGTVMIGRGVQRALVGTIVLHGGKRQVTYAGHPLYTYIADIHAGQTSYVNFLQFGGRWPAVNAAGHEVK